MANYGIGIGAFADGIVRGMQLGKMVRDASDQYDARKTTKDALDAAKSDREAAVNAEAARLMGIGPQGPQAPSPDGSAVQTQPVNMNSPQGAPLPDQGAAPPAAAPTVVPTPSPAVGTPAMPAPAAAAPAPAASPMTPAPAPAAPASAGPTQSALTPNQVVASRGLPAQSAPMSADDARALADKSAPSVMEFFQKKGVPKIAETYLAQGDPAKAQAWMDWADQAENKRNMATWAKAWRATQLGDIEGAADHFMDLYKSYQDGVTPISKEVVKDKDGNITGFNVKLRNDSTGEERSQFVDRTQLLNMGLASLSPPQMFEAEWKRQQAVDAAKAKVQQMVAQTKLDTAKEITVENARQGNRVALEGIKSNAAMDRDANKAKLDAANQKSKVQNELDAKVGALKSAGYSDDFIKNALPDILGVNQYKKATSPDEAKRLAFGDRMKNDPTFAYKSADQQRQIIDQDMGLIYGGMKPSSAPAPASGASTGTTPNPFNNGAAPPRGLPVLDTKTGKIVYR